MALRLSLSSEEINVKTQYVVLKILLKMKQAEINVFASGILKFLLNTYLNEKTVTIKRQIKEIDKPIKLSIILYYLSFKLF